MKITSILATGLMVAGLIVSASAQGPKMGGPGGPGGPGGHRPKPGQMEMDILSKLDLNKSQKAKVKMLTDGFAKKMEAMRPPRGAGGKGGPGGPGGPGGRGAGGGPGGPGGGPGGPGGGDRSAMREKFKAMRDDYNAHLSKILTKSQMDKYTKMHDEMRAKMRASMGGRGGGGGRGGR